MIEAPPRPRAAARVHRRPAARAARHGRRPDDRPDAPLRRRGALVPRSRAAGATSRAPSATLARARVPRGGRAPRAARRARAPNLPFREPLVPTGAPLVDAPGRAGGAPWTRVRAGRPPAASGRRRAARGPGARAPARAAGRGWGAGVRADDRRPVRDRRRVAGARRPDLAAPQRLARGRRPTKRCCARRRSRTAHRPELVRARRRAAHEQGRERSGSIPSIEQVLVDPDDAWLDPQRTRPANAVAADADALPRTRSPTASDRRGASPWLAAWQRRRTAGARRARRVLDEATAPFEGLIARDVAAALPDGGVARGRVEPARCARSSGAWRPVAGVRVLANRGANGIDGFVSTVVGVAGLRIRRRRSRSAGDLCFLHDTNGLLGADAAPATFVVVDNDGGGIFSYLPPAELPEFEELFATPHGLDLVEVARAHGAYAERIDDTRKLVDAVLAPADAPRVFVVPVDRASSVGQHRALWDAVADALGLGPYQRAQHRLELHLRLGPLRLGVASRRRCRRPRGAARGCRRARHRAARRRTRRRRRRRPNRTDPRSGRAASARAA